MQVIWEEFLRIIKEEAGSRVVETWFKVVCLKEWDSTNKTVCLQTPNQFVAKWLQEHYITLIKTHLSRLLHHEVTNVIFVSNTQDAKNERNIIPASVIASNSNEIEKIKIHANFTQNFVESNSNSLIVKRENLPSKFSKPIKKELFHLNNTYHFDSFIVGPSNSLAHAAAHAICQNLGKVYNPLFIYGGTGLGKTHLLHAIGNEIRKTKSSSIVQYETSDRFTNEFINSIRLDKIQHFREKYQKVDLLLIDDIQFLSNKEQTQEIFFHIFNLLYEQGKQIVLSSDTFPKEIAGLQNRLKSRLEWGLVVDIQLPDLETKIAILKRKAEINLINLNDDVANFIASRIKSNIRELEGALVRVGAFSTLTNQPISLDLAKKVLLNLNEKKKEGIMLEDILRLVAKHYSISIPDLKSKNRQMNVALARQVALYMMKKLTFTSLQAIGNFVGKRDHSTVLHAISKIESLCEQDKSFAQKLISIEQDILMS